VNGKESTSIVVTCARGIAPYLAEELGCLGVPLLGETETAVETEGTLEDAMRLNLHLRTAHRVLLKLFSFQADGPDPLYRAVTAFPWEAFLADRGYFSVTATVRNPAIRDTRFAALRVKDGIADRFYRKRGHRPDSGPRRYEAVFHLHWIEMEASLFLDTSGEPLSRRGYRKRPWKAPMAETLAAAAIAASRWDRESPFVNPMCGSGTLAIEAALAALGRPPGRTRKNFGFMHVPGFPKGSWKKILEEAEKRERASLPFKIVATDWDPEALSAAEQNARAAGVENHISFSLGPFEETEIPEGKGVIFMNPEYGERMGDAARLKDVYRRIGDFMKEKGRGYRGFIFTGNPELAKAVGLKARRRIPFFNGPLECRLLEYELYEGSRRGRFPQGNGSGDDPRKERSHTP